VIFDAIFDLDGTLVDSVPVCAEILNAMLADRGSVVRVPYAQARKHVSVGGVPMMRALLGRNCRDPEQEIDDFRERYANAVTPFTSLYPGVLEGLALLRSREVRLSICSSKPQYLCEKVVAELGLNHLFSLIVGGQTGRAKKPDVALYDEVIGRLSGRRDRSCYVGDSELDFRLAEACRVPFVFATYGYGLKFRAPGALRASHFSDVPRRVDEIRGGMPATTTTMEATPPR